MKFASFCFLSSVCGVLGDKLPRDGESNACASVSKAYVAAVLGSTAAIVPAKLAYECLISVPLNKQAAVDLVQAIIPYVEWQSDTSYLKDPPRGYRVPGIDLFGTFNDMIRDLKRGEYENEHEFQTDLFKTFNAAHDGHFRFAPDLLSRIGFRRKVQLVSVSRDGIELPKVYVRNDITTSTKNSTLTASPITKINGQDVDKYLENLSKLGFLQDLDALYNNQFYSLALDAQYDNYRYTGYFAGAGRAGMIYQGPETVLQFANKTVRKYENYAEIVGNWKGVVDGPSAYEKFCTGPKIYNPANDDIEFLSEADAILTERDKSSFAHGYPVPKGISSDKQVSSYFLDDEPGFEDVAVLSLLTFEPNYPSEFQNIIENFIWDAKSAGKTKIVIDLSGNGGGIILNGYDAFRQFFPHITQDGFSRFREHDAFNIMSKQISNFTSGLRLETASMNQVLARQSVLSYRFDLNATNQNFLDYESKFRPQHFREDEFTQLLRWNLSDPLLTSSYQYGLGMTITGYGDRINFKQPFASEDIVMVYDGYCASTCAIFSEFMRTQGGVKSIAMGGRPNRSPIQAIGGTKGSNNYPFSYINFLANLALDTATPAQRTAWKSVTDLSRLPLNRSTDSSINVRDMILRDNLRDGTPAQFLYEAADCRLFYEPEMMKDPKAIWKKAAEAAWKGKKCVAGGLKARMETSSMRRESVEMVQRARFENFARAYQIPAEKPEWRKQPVFGKKVPL